MEKLKCCENVVLVCCTYNGQPPDTAVDFLKDLAAVAAAEKAGVLRSVLGGSLFGCCLLAFGTLVS